VNLCNAPLGNGAVPVPPKELMARLVELLRECLELIPARHAVYFAEQGEHPLAIVISPDAAKSPHTGTDQHVWVPPFSAEFKETATLAPCSRPGGSMFVLHKGRSVYSVHDLDSPEQGESVSLHRGPSDPAFTDRELVMLETLHHAHRSSALGQDNNSPPELPPRQRQVLLALLEGCSEKEVAAQLGISRHTVHIYVKAIYRHYGVCSRSELMSQLLRHGGQGAILKPTGIHAQAGVDS
jgi:DNA-binding CsgD family transcriptional regulator